MIVGACVATFSREGKVAWALQGLGIAIALHTIYDGLLFSVNGGASIAFVSALAVDGFTLVLALIVRRMGRIQKFSQGEGRDLMVQVRLMRRFRPDRSEGLGHMVTGSSFLGLLQVLLFFFASATYFSLGAGGFISVAESPAGFVTGWLSWVTRRALSRRSIDRSCGRRRSRRKPPSQTQWIRRLSSAVRCPRSWIDCPRSCPSNKSNRPCFGCMPSLLSM